VAPVCAVGNAVTAGCSAVGAAVLNAVGLPQFGQKPALCGTELPHFAHAEVGAPSI
jgi:hypothetical protein